MIHPHDNEFEVIARGETIETTERRPYGGDHTILVYCFERPVMVRCHLVCQQCGQEFSYDLDAVLSWEKGYRHETTERDALGRLFARERQRISTPGHDSPVSCPHCGVIQGAGSAPRTGSAKVIEWIRRMTGRGRQHD